MKIKVNTPIALCGGVASAVHSGILTSAAKHNGPLAPSPASHAYLGNANLSDADLGGADLSDAKNLTQTQLDKACGNAKTKLAKSLTLKPCLTDDWAGRPRR